MATKKKDTTGTKQPVPAARAIEAIAQHLRSAKAPFESITKEARTEMVFAIEARFALKILDAALADPRKKALVDAAAKNPKSLCDAVIQAASTGLSLDDSKKQAYLIPYDSKTGGLPEVRFSPSYIGLTDAAYATGMFKAIRTNVVREGDLFEWWEDETGVHYKFRPGKQRGSVTHAYTAATTKDGEVFFEVMDRDELEAISERSPAGAKGVGPWASDPSEMSRKSVTRRAQKRWPTPPRSAFARTIEALDRANPGLAEHRGPDGARNITPDPEERPSSDFSQEFLDEFGGEGEGAADGGSFIQKITEEQAIGIVTACAENEVDLGMILSTIGLKQIEDLPAAEFETLNSRIAGFVERRAAAKKEKEKEKGNGDNADDPLPY